MNDYIYEKELYHQGIKGQKWGIRRFQNEDGTLTEAGKKRYRVDSIQEYRKQQIDSNNRRINDEKQKLEETKKNLNSAKTLGESDKNYQNYRHDKIAELRDWEGLETEPKSGNLLEGLDKYSIDEKETYKGYIKSLQSDMKASKKKIDDLVYKNKYISSLKPNDPSFLEIEDHVNSVRAGATMTGLAVGGAAGLAVAPWTFGMGFIPLGFAGAMGGDSVGNVLTKSASKEAKRLREEYDRKNSK